MKHLIFFLISSFTISAQNLSPEEQKKLIEENRILKDQLQKSKSSTTPSDSAKIMQALKRGEKFQKEQNQMLEELDKED